MSTEPNDLAGPSLPFGVPRASRVRGATIAIGTLGAGVSTSEWLVAIGEPPDRLHLAVLGPTCVLIALFLWVATRPSLSPRSGMASMALGLPFGGLNGVLIVLALALVEGGPRDVVSLAIAAAVFGAFVAIPYTLALLPFVGRFLALRRRRSLDTGDRLRADAGLWLFAIGLVCAAVPVSRLSAVGWQSVSALPAAAALVFGALLALSGFGRLFARRRWLRKVAGGRVPGWVVVPRESYEGAPDAVTLASFVAISRQGEGTGFLARVTPRASAYREADRAVPVARVA